MAPEQIADSLNRLSYRAQDYNAPENRAIGAMITSLRWSGVPDATIHRAVGDAYNCVTDRTPVPEPEVAL